MKKTLASLVTALSLGMGCAHSTTEAEYNYGIQYSHKDSMYPEEMLSLHGVSVRQNLDEHVVGLDVFYGERKSTRFEDEITVSVITLPVIGTTTDYVVKISPYVERKLLDMKVCDYFSFNLGVGAGVEVKVTASGTEFNIDGNEMGSLPSGISVEGSAFLHARTGVQIWKIPLNYTFRADHNGIITMFVSGGYEF